MGNRPEYSFGNVKLVRGVEITDNLQIGLWLNVKDPDLNARLIQYYTEQQKDQENGWRNQPGVQLEVRIGDNYHKVASAQLRFNVGAPAQQPAVTPPPPPPNVPPPPPPPHTTVPDAPPPPFGHSEAKDG